MVVVGIVRIGGETWEVRKGGRRYNGECGLAFALVLVFVDSAHDRGQDTRVPSAARTPKAETRTGETHTGGDTARGGEGSFLGERGRLLLLLLLLVVSIQLILLLLQW